jgi:hypothetical protein
MKNDKDAKEKQSLSPLEADLVAVGDDGRYRFRKQSIGLSSALEKEKREAKANALTFSMDDGGWRNDAALRRNDDAVEEETSE